MQIFRTTREKLGWSSYKMAKELGISQSQYQYIEQVAEYTRTETLVRLVDVWLKNKLGNERQFIAELRKEVDAD